MLIVDVSLGPSRYSELSMPSC